MSDLISIPEAAHQLYTTPRQIRRWLNGGLTLHHKAGLRVALTPVVRGGRSYLQRAAIDSLRRLLGP